MGHRRRRTERDNDSGKSRAGAAVAPASPVVLGLGAAFVLVSLAASFMLVLEHMGGLSLPGCGPGSACAQVTSSVWGKIPLGAVKWPVSHVGLAYFLAVLVVWLGSGRGVPAGSVRVD